MTLNENPKMLATQSSANKVRKPGKKRSEAEFHLCPVGLKPPPSAEMELTLPPPQVLEKCVRWLRLVAQM